MRLKRVLALVMTLSLSFSILACGAKTETTADGQVETPETEVETPETEVSEVTGEYDTGNFSADVQKFFLDSAVNYNGSKDWVRSTAVQLSKECNVPFEIMPVDIEAGLLTGFGNTEITGFEHGVMFGPMIGSIPFVGYIFDLADDTDINVFMDTLVQNADLRWNVCVAADVITCTSIDTGDNGELVLFVMHPESFDDCDTPNHDIPVDDAE